MSYTEWKDKTDGFKQIDVRGVQGDIMNEAIKAGEVFKLAELVPYVEGKIAVKATKRFKMALLLTLE